MTLPMDKKTIIPALALGVFLSWNACTTKPLEVKADSDYVTFMGRTYVTDDGGVGFNYPGVTAMLRFKGERVDMLTSPGSGYYVVQIDGGEPRKVLVADDDSVVTVADYLTDGEHELRITYAIEGYEKNPVIRGFVLPRGGRVLEAPEKGELKIEFIGNSITCGYGAEVSDGEGSFSYDTENFCNTYAYLTGRALDADVNVVARSGIGIYRNYNGPRDGDIWGTMPMEYDHTMVYDTIHSWDFSRFQPDIVCINLGTNDASTDNYDISLFEAEYDRFLTRLRGYYPSAKIVLLSGCMLQGRPLEDVKGVLDRLSERHEGTYRFDMSPQTGELGMGVNNHPSPGQHKKMADELTEYLKTIM